MLTHPTIAKWVLGLFVLTVVTKLQLARGGPSDPMVLIDGLTSGALALGTASWFILCFTGDAGRRIHDIFVFAYAFTIGSFAMLVLPFVTEQHSESTVRLATLQLVRGCVRDAAMGGLGSVSAVVLCPADKAERAAKYPWPNYRASESNDLPHYGELRYTLMLAIGGVTATVFNDPLPSKDLAPPFSPPASAAAAPAASAASAPAWPAAHQHLEVMGGLAVPFFVLVLAFIGGAVSLSRRIPEYQRRLHVQYKPLQDESAIRPFEAREFVVFQIMQLVSAPFLAVATWFIVTPMGLTSAATLAFGTGFASEYLLLMIRGLVKGIRPESSRAKPAPDADAGAAGDAAADATKAEAQAKADADAKAKADTEAQAKTKAEVEAKADAQAKADAEAKADADADAKAEVETPLAAAGPATPPAAAGPAAAPTPP